MDYTQLIEYSQEIKHDTLFIRGKGGVLDILWPIIRDYEAQRDNWIQPDIQARDISKYYSSAQKGLPCSTETIDTLCFILDCEVEDIIKHDKTN